MRSDADEVLEVLDEAGDPTGVGKARGAVHADGDWHRAFHLWVMHPDGHVLLQRRSRTKDLAGGKVDVSVGGHVRPGETVLDMLREAEEEIGLVVAPGRADFLATLRSERRYERGAVDREFQDVYATLVVDHDLTDYALDCDEVAVLYEAPLERLIAFYRDGGSLPVAGWDCQQRHNHALLIDDDVVEEGRALTLESLELVEAWWRELGDAPGRRSGAASRDDPDRGSLDPRSG